MSRPAPDAPGVVIFPPLLFGGTLVIGSLAHLIHPLSLHLGWGARISGIAIALAGAVFAVTGRRALTRAGTNVNPTKPTTAIVTDGPYRFTRNPLYLALTLVYLGTTLLINALVPLLLLPIVLVIADLGVIRREERYLEGKFGDVYRDYRRRVRRWI